MTPWNVDKINEEFEFLTTSAETYLGRLRWGDLRERSKDAIHDIRLAEFWVYSGLRGKAYSPSALLDQLRKMLADEETARRTATANCADDFIVHWRALIEGLIIRFGGHNQNSL